MMYSYTAKRLVALAVLTCAFSAAFNTSAWAQRGPTVENLRVGFDASASSLQAADTFKIGTWTPVWVQIRSGSEPFRGFMSVVVTDDDATPTSFRLAVDMPANQSQRLTAYARPGSRQPEFTIRLEDPDGRRIGGGSQAVIMPRPPEAIMPDESVILTMGRPMGVDTIVELPGFRNASRDPNKNATGAEIVTARIDTQAGLLPARWYGYDAARAIVIDTDDRDAMASLDGFRGQGLVDWVARGGHLVVSVGGNWQAVRDSALAPILPGLPVGQERVTSLESLETYAGSSKPITPPGSPAVMVTKLDAIESRGGAVLATTSNLPLVVRGAHGFGRVTLITIDVDQKPFSDWADRSLFWLRALDLRRARADQAGAGNQLGGGRFFQSGVTDLASELRVALEQFPGVKLIPFGWVAFFIFLYILLIGPIDYFFLKKILKRMELTWVTFPAIVLTVSLLAYYAAYALKGNDLLVNQVDIVDIDQVSGQTRGHSFMSVFSPQNRDYDIQMIPERFDRGVATAPASRSPATRAAAGIEVLTTWFSAPEDQFGAMGSSSRRFSFVGSGYTYQPTGGVETLENVRIPIWSTKCIMSRWFGESGSLVDSDLSIVGTDRVAGTVTNRQEIPLEDAILAFGKHVYELGDLAAGATVRVELSGRDRNLSGFLKDRQKNFLSDQPANRESKVDRRDVALSIMFHDSESSIAIDRSLTNEPLHELDLTGQLLLNRPMLVARVKNAGARLVLEKASTQPRVDQLTMVRIILPLKKTKS